MADADFRDVECPHCRLGMMVDADATIIKCDQCGNRFDSQSAKAQVVDIQQ